MIPSDILAKAKEYINFEENSFFRKQVEKLLGQGQADELTDRFYTDLEFGTGGLRGVIGGGYNRMNPYTVRRATQGLANYINKAAGPGKGSAVIAYDSRNYSDLFALEAALVLCGNGIHTFLFSSLRPTPELSFAVRQLKCTAGIVVTASHNPPEYNGYKVYWSDGAQVVAPHDESIIGEVRGAGPSPVVISRDEAVCRDLLRVIDSEIDDPFIAMVKGCALQPELLRSHGSTFKVVFTPLHGSGSIPVARALEEMGVRVIFVPEQKEPDGNFPTVKYPNPEEASAMHLALSLAQQKFADLVISTDPDADRLAIAAPDGTSIRLITGNQLGALFADYIFSAHAQAGTMPNDPVLIKTIVTTELQRLIAESYGATCVDTLTGFKYIGQKIGEFEAAGSPSYVVGGEESYGYLVNTAVRDKDAVSAATMAVEMALYHRINGRTLFDQLAALWEKFGYFQETQISKAFKGQSGVATMQALMQRLRTEPPREIGGMRIVELRDYRDGSTRFMPDGAVEKNIRLPSSNVIQLLLEDESIITARPSGTEPKIKFYASCRSRSGVPLESARRQVQSAIDRISDAINHLIAGE